MKTIGIGGGSGCGKGEVCKIFAELGYPIIDADQIYHEMVSSKSECVDEIVKEFGKGVLNEDGSLNRKKLSIKAFSKPEKLWMLNKITHPYIIAKIEEKVEEYRKQGHKAVMIDAPVIYESNLYYKCDEVICVYADYYTRIDRIMARDRISQNDAENRINNQLAMDWFRSQSHYVIDNTSDLYELRLETLAVKRRLFDDIY